MRGNYAGECRRQLRPHGNFAFAFVGEIEKLVDNFGAALLSIKISRFEHGSVPFDKAVTARNLPPAPKDVIPRGAILGQKIPKTWKRLHHFNNRPADSARTICSGAVE